MTLNPASGIFQKSHPESCLGERLPQARGTDHLPSFPPVICPGLVPGHRALSVVLPLAGYTVSGYVYVTDC